MSFFCCCYKYLLCDLWLNNKETSVVFFSFHNTMNEWLVLDSLCVLDITLNYIVNKDPVLDLWEYGIPPPLPLHSGSLRLTLLVKIKIPIMVQIDLFENDKNIWNYITPCKQRIIIVKYE